MSSKPANGAELLCATLEALGVEHAFGVPGSQNVLLYDALRRSSIRSVLTSHELGAAFMANGYFRASGKPAALVTIPGPGFAYAIPGLAEALHDSVAVLHVVGQPAAAPGNRYQFQALDQVSIARPLAKLVQDINRTDDIPRLVTEAYAAAMSGQPGPVLLHWSAPALAGAVTAAFTLPNPPPPPPLDEALVAAVAEALRSAVRPLLFIGQGTAATAPRVVELAEVLQAPVFTTASGRGILPEDHPLALGFDFARGNVSALNELVRTSDCVLAIGCKLSHGGTGGFRLVLPPARLIHVDPSREVLGANYPAALLVPECAESFLERLLPLVRSVRNAPGPGWNAAEIAAWRVRCRAVPSSGAAGEPVVHGVTPPTAAGFFAVLRRVLPRDAIVVTDSGLHQGLVRRHFDVLSPRGLILPSDFQSMGFGLPAAIGAKLAAPERAVVAVIGDGAFAMSAMELLTAVRERIPLTVIVLNDGKLNQIRLQQQGEFGWSESVELLNPDFEMFATAMRMRYVPVDSDLEGQLRTALAGDAVTLVEVRVGDSMGMRLSRAGGFARETARRALGPRVVGWLKDALRRR